MTAQDSEYLDEVLSGIFQLIGNPSRLKAMIGANSFSKGYFDGSNHPGIQFNFPRCNRINCCQLTLDIDQDLYRLKFFDISNLKLVDRGAYPNLFVDTVRRTFEERTGLYLTFS
jgi:hypothetical protein